MRVHLLKSHYVIKCLHFDVNDVFSTHLLPMEIKQLVWNETTLPNIYNPLKSVIIQQLKIMTFHAWVAPCAKVSLRICGQPRPGSACASAQADPGLHCLLTESLDTVDCFNTMRLREYMQDDIDFADYWIKLYKAAFGNNAQNNENRRLGFNKSLHKQQFSLWSYIWSPSTGYSIFKVNRIG